MNEKEWVARVVELLDPLLKEYDENLSISQGTKLTYAYEIRNYEPDGENTDISKYETDLLVTENQEDGSWKPRLVIEAKVNSVTTHDAITYSQKAFAHKQVHPYLRYGIIIGNRKHHPLPGRLFRHGAYFDFMLSWRKYEPEEAELKALLTLVIEEVEASRKLEEILYSSRKSDRERYTMLHRPLKLS